EISEKNTELRDLSEQIKISVGDRTAALKKLKTKFDSLNQTENKIRFGIEIQFNPQKIENLSARFNRKESSDFIDRDNEVLKVDVIRSNPHDFLEAIYGKKQKVLFNENFQECTRDALTFIEDIRFNSTMENDTIGGFSNSSMTEGKQALFALTLLLNKESDTWPLLIDQPEDDLDSRSMYDLIVPYLKDQKKRRQIVMVSHNANLVIGSDSEQIIVANQHGDDRKNKDNQKFDYFTGALEYTKERDEDENIVLMSRGIREHACDILDGGETAFEKRKDKYNI
ncbi:MAG: AAA family ATPase, partial [Candidatus Omnitrophota bacterium]